LKRLTNLLIAALFFATTSSASEPLTEAEALEYVQRFPEAAAADVMRLEAIERVVPEITFPQYLIVVTQDGRMLEVTATPQNELRIDAGTVGWEIIPPTLRKRVDGPPRGASVVAIGAGFTAGALLTLLLLVPRL
jgi:hypothetical protein